MKSLAAALLAVALALLACAAPSAQERIGEISYLENDLAVTRNGRILDADSVQIGADVQNLDLLRTGRTGYAEIELDDPRASQIKLSPGTTLYLERSLGRTRKTTVGAITGSIALKVQKLGANQQLQVAAEAALMGARGTSFEVTLSPAGDLLVTCSEGEVLCQEEDGAELSAVPGSAVEQSAGEGFQQVPVAVSDLARFRQDWYAERLELFKASPLRAVRFYARRYQELRQRFARAYEALAAQRQVLDKWYREDRAGRIGGNLEILREKKRIIPYLLELRKVLFLFERVYFRVDELRDYYRQGFGEGTLEGGLTSRAFFQGFDRDRDVLARQMAEVRYVSKLYLKRNQGVFASGGAEESEADF
jgi:hypothetical protein